MSVGVSSNAYAYVDGDNPDGTAEACEKCGVCTFRYNEKLVSMPCWEGSHDFKLDCTPEDAGDCCCDPMQIDTSNCHCTYDYA
ncbi:MAG: hypothetical protein PHD21_03195 [Flavobacteriales bacterium]|nr:hypothetical protein [Flavobacteriales bacterium]